MTAHAGEVVESGNTPTLLLGVHMCTATLDIYTVVSQNLPQDSAIPLSVIYPGDVPSFHKDTYIIMFIAALFTIARN